LTAVIGTTELARLIAFARAIHVSPVVEEYAVSLARATRTDPALHLGASPRATLQLIRAAKVWAALDHREYVLPDDVSDLISAVFAHRMLPARGAQRAGAQPVQDALTRIVAATPVPVALRT